MKLNRNTLLLLVALIAFHFSISAVSSFIAKSDILSAYHNGDGIWNYAYDSISYHAWASEMAKYLEEGRYSEWLSLKTSYFHLKIISLTYFLFSPDPLSFAPVNAIIWALIFFIIYEISKIIIMREDKYALYPAFVFSLWPSNLAFSTQLLKDPFFNLGCAVFVLGWTKILNGNTRASSIIFILFGFILCDTTKIEATNLFILISMIAIIMTLIFSRKSAGPALLAAGLIVFYMVIPPLSAFAQIKSENTFDTQQQANIEKVNNQVKQIIGDAYTLKTEALVNKWLMSQWFSRIITFKDRRRVLLELAKEHTYNLDEVLEKLSLNWDFSPWIPRRVDEIIMHANDYRNSFLSFYLVANSSAIDTDVIFSNAGETLRYIPRAIEISLFAPFPNMWFEKGNIGGKVIRTLAGIEMFFIYILYAGLLYFLATSKLPAHLKIWLVVSPLVMLLPLGLFVPNIGTLFRMRFIYLALPFIGGVEGLRMIADKYVSSHIQVATS